MLNTLYRSIYTFTANTSFEKVEYNKKEARLEATCNKDYLPPSESSIKILINTFRGLDTETRPQQAFNTIVLKILHSESRNMWNYMIKNLIMLDRCVEEKLFLWEIADLQLDTVESFTDQDQKINTMLINFLIKKYYDYIKIKAAKYTSKDSVFNQTDKNDYFAKISINQLISEIKIV